MVFWVTRATEDFVCNTFRAMTMANFHLTKKPTLPGIWTAWGSCSWTMMIMMKTMTMKSRSHCLMEKRVIHMWGGSWEQAEKSITPELNCYSCVIIFFLFPFFPPFCLSQNVLIHNMYSYPDCRRQAKGNETGKRIPFRSPIKDHTCINSLFSLQGAIIAIVTSS